MGLPKISFGKTDTRVARGSETANTAAARANQRLGEEITRTGEKLGSIANRRMREEAKDIEATQRATDRLNSAAEFESMKEKFRDDPLGFRDALIKTQNSRRKKALEGIANPIARENVKKNFEIAELENGLLAASHERVQFTKNVKANTRANAEKKATADFNMPPSQAEFMVDLDEDIDGINIKDMDEESKAKLVKDTTKIRVKGIVTGYIRGGRTQDFLRAEKLVTDLGPKLNNEDATRMLRRISIDRNRKLNEDARNERLARTEIGKQFQQERGQIRNVLQKKLDGGDIEDDLSKLKNFGKISTDTFTVLKESEMTEDQIGKSGSLTLAMYDQISRTNKKDVFTLREEVNMLITTGQISAEDGVSIMDSLGARENTPYSRVQQRNAFKFMKETVSTGFNINKRTEEKRYLRMVDLTSKLVLNEGVDWVTASRVAMKSEGIDKEFAVKEETIAARERNLKKKLQSKSITREEAMPKFRKLKKQREMLGIFDGIPTLEELRGAQK